MSDGLLAQVELVAAPPLEPISHPLRILGEASSSSSTPRIPSGSLANLTYSSSSRPMDPRSSTSTLMSERRPDLKLTLSSDEQADFSAAIHQARKNMVSDAARLPKSTNMGLGNRPPSAATIAPASKAQPIGRSERAMIPTATEMERAASYSMSGHVKGKYNFDEDNGDAKEVRRAPTSSVHYLQAIPCFFVTNVKSATTFYRDILGFEIFGKPDTSHATLYRMPPKPSSSSYSSSSSSSSAIPSMRNSPEGGKMEPPGGSVQMYLRIAPMGPDGIRVKPPAVTLWMLVNDVDEVFKEITFKWSKFQPRENEYFPTHLFGEAKILAKPQNKAWGTRELHVVDGDDNKIIFFRHI